jgi:inactivated superfamily I helicase
MGTKSLKDEYLEKLSSKLQQLNLEAEIFQSTADKTVGLSKAKYLEQVKSIREKGELLNEFIKQIMKAGNQLDRMEFRKKIDDLLKEIESATEEEKHRLIDLFK